MTFETVTVSDADGIAIVTLNRPEKLNAMSNALKRELRQVAEALDERDDLSCVLVTGAGRAFSASPRSIPTAPSPRTWRAGNWPRWGCSPGLAPSPSPTASRR